MGGRLTLVETEIRLKLIQAEAGMLLGQSVDHSNTVAVEMKAPLTLGCVKLRRKGGGATP